MKEDTRLSFCGISGLLNISPAALVPSPTRVVVIAIVVAVPTAYENKNDKFPPQVATASAGASEGAPSQLKPCSKPLKTTARFFC